MRTGPDGLGPGWRHGGSGAGRGQDPGVRHRRTPGSLSRGRGGVGACCGHPSGGRLTAPVEEGIRGPRSDNCHNRRGRKSHQENVLKGPSDLRARTTKHGPHPPPSSISASGYTSVSPWSRAQKACSFRGEEPRPALRGAVRVKGSPGGESFNNFARSRILLFASVVVPGESFGL